jgi:hypothetical protein
MHPRIKILEIGSDYTIKEDPDSKDICRNTGLGVGSFCDIDGDGLDDAILSYGGRYGPEIFMNEGGFFGKGKMLRLCGPGPDPRHAFMFLNYNDGHQYIVAGTRDNTFLYRSKMPAFVRK